MAWFPRRHRATPGPDPGGGASAPTDAPADVVPFGAARVAPVTDPSPITEDLLLAEDSLLDTIALTPSVGLMPDPFAGRRPPAVGSGRAEGRRVPPPLAPRPTAPTVRSRVVRHRCVPGRAAGRRRSGGQRAQHRGHRAHRPAAHPAAVRGRGPAARALLRPVHARLGPAGRRGATDRRRQRPGPSRSRSTAWTTRLYRRCLIGLGVWVVVLAGHRGAPGLGPAAAQLGGRRRRAHRRRGVVPAVHRPGRAPGPPALRRARPEPDGGDRDPDRLRPGLRRRRIRHPRLRRRASCSARWRPPGTPACSPVGPGTIRPRPRPHPTWRRARPDPLDRPRRRRWSASSCSGCSRTPTSSWSDGSTRPAPGPYAAISVASKSLVFGAILLGSYVLPEAAIRWHQGQHALRQLAVTLVFLLVPVGGAPRASRWWPRSGSSPPSSRPSSTGPHRPSPPWWGPWPAWASW